MSPICQLPPPEVSSIAFRIPVPLRPHKDVLFRICESYRKGELQPLRDEHWDTIEEKETAAASEPY